AVAVLVNLGPYPASMVDVPGSEASNSAPPTLVLLALGILQTGLLAALEPVANRWLRGPRPWAATVLVNGMIMTLFVWHLSAMILALGLALLLGGVGLSIEPAGAIWWLTRPLWMAVYAVFLAAAAVPFGRFERLSVRPDARPLPTWAAVLGTVAVCAGLGMLAYGGIWSEWWPGVNLPAAGLCFAGAALIGVLRAGEKGGARPS
ncbi:MAG: acyltransferase, partial [Acidimicrobiia bacterium]|nr:acyltransferase [Acidimicrobiia bacterium]